MFVFKCLLFCGVLVLVFSEDVGKLEDKSIDPIIDQDLTERDHSKRTIFNHQHSNLGWAKHVKFRGGQRLVLGYSPLGLKYLPVGKPILLKPVHAGYRLKPRPQWKPKRVVPLIPSKPVLQTDGWKPIVPIHVPAPPQIEPKPWQEQGWGNPKPVLQGQTKPTIVHHVDHHVHVEQPKPAAVTPVEQPKPVLVHIEPAKPVQVYYPKPILTDHVHQHVQHGNHVDDVIKPVLTDHVHQHVQHGNHVDDVVKPVLYPQPPQFVFYNPVQKPQLSVLPLGSAFPAPVLVPQVTHLHPVDLHPEAHHQVPQVHHPEIHHQLPAHHPVVQQYPHLHPVVPQVVPQVPQIHQQIPQVVQQVPHIHQHIHQQPQFVQQGPFIHQQVPHVLQQVPHIHQQVPQVHQQVPQVVHQQVPQVVHQQVPQVHQQVPHIHQQVPHVHQQVPQVHQQVPQVHQQVPQVVQQVPHIHQQVPQVHQHVPHINELSPQFPHIHQQVPQEFPYGQAPQQAPDVVPTYPSHFGFTQQSAVPNPTAQTVPQSTPNYQNQLVIEYHGSKAHLIQPYDSQYVPENYNPDILPGSDGRPSQDLTNYYRSENGQQYDQSFHDQTAGYYTQGARYEVSEPEEADEGQGIQPGQTDLQLPAYLPQHPNYRPEYREGYQGGYEDIDRSAQESQEDLK